MKKYCVIGHPVAHSLSPQIHNAAFKALGIDAEYEKIDLPPSELPSFMGNFTKKYSGANVTIPHKRDVMAYLDKLDVEAREISAVNVIVNENGKLVGYNTDVYGAMMALCERISGNDCETAIRTKFLSGKKIVILGAGGAAHAVAYGCAKAGANINILNRTPDHAKQLASDLNDLHRATSLVVKYGNLKDFNPEHCDILINTTSCGLASASATDESPIGLLKNRLEFSNNKFVVMDVIYNPLKTKLLRDAESIGCKIITGDKMFLYQAARAFELWTGQTALIDVMKQCLKSAHILE